MISYFVSSHTDVPRASCRVPSQRTFVIDQDDWILAKFVFAFLRTEKWS